MRSFQAARERLNVISLHKILLVGVLLVNFIHMSIDTFLCGNLIFLYIHKIRPKWLLFY